MTLVRIFVLNGSLSVLYSGATTTTAQTTETCPGGMSNTDVMDAMQSIPAASTKSGNVAKYTITLQGGSASVSLTTESVPAVLRGLRIQIKGADDVKASARVVKETSAGSSSTTEATQLVPDTSGSSGSDPKTTVLKATSPSISQTRLTVQVTLTSSKAPTAQLEVTVEVEACLKPGETH